MEFKHPGEEAEAACAMTAFIRSTSQFNSRQVQSAGDAAIGYSGDYGKSPCYRLADIASNAMTCADIACVLAESKDAVRSALHALERRELIRRQKLGNGRITWLRITK